MRFPVELTTDPSAKATSTSGTTTWCCRQKTSRTRSRNVCHNLGTWHLSMAPGDEHAPKPEEGSSTIELNGHQHQGLVVSLRHKWRQSKHGPCAVVQWSHMCECGFVLQRVPHLQQHGRWSKRYRCSPTPTKRNSRAKMPTSGAGTVDP